MDDLPNISGTNATQPAAPGMPLAGSMAKEVLPPSGTPESPIFSEVGKETELPAEVKRAGVMMRSDSVVLPIPVQQLGVTAAPQQAAPAAVKAVVLPLTDDQIAQGLHQSIVSSWRWLAEWCNRQLKHAHILLKAVGGKVERSSS